jgi:hypothetical protein
MYRVKLGYKTGSPVRGIFDDIEIVESNFKTFSGNGWGNFSAITANCFT